LSINEKHVTPQWKKLFLNLCFRPVAELEKVFRWIKIVLTGQTDQQLSGEKEIKKGKFILISAKKFG
jgi:uncharacterized protein YpbB